MYRNILIIQYNLIGLHGLLVIYCKKTKKFEIYHSIVILYNIICILFISVYTQNDF